MLVRLLHGILWLLRASSKSVEHDSLSVLRSGTFLSWRQNTSNSKAIRLHHLLNSALFMWFPGNASSESSSHPSGVTCLIPTLCNGVSEFGVSDSPCNTSTKNECGVNLHYVKVGLSRRVCCFYRYCMSRKTRQNSWFVFYLTQLKKVSSVCLPIIKKTRVRVVKENIQRVICSHCKVL